MASSLVVMPLEIKPVTLPEPLRASLEDPPEDPEDLREHYTSHGRTFTANGWRWGWTWIDNKRVSRRFRLRPGERKRGELRWRAGRKTTTLTRVLSAQLGAGETKDWDLVADWSVAPSGQRLFCITGYFWMKRGGTSGALYAVDLPGGAVTKIVHPNSVKGGRLNEVVAVADDEALLRTRSALRWFRREGARWRELATLRVPAGIELSYGEIDGRRIAALRCHDDKRSLFVELKGKRLVKLGEVLRPTRQVAIRDGRALVHVDGRWHAVLLPRSSTSARSAARPREPKAPPHPLLKALVTARPPTTTVTPLSRARAAKIGACELGPRICGRGLAAGVSRGHLIVDRARHDLRRIPVPEGTSEFDVSEGDLAAYVICRERGKISSQLMTRAIEGRARWREIKVAAQAPCGPEMLAHLGDDHLVVRSYEALELLRRENGRWSTLHQLRCPRRTTLLAIPKRACVLAATSSVLTFYGRSGDQLVKLTTGRIARRADGNHPTAFVRADGALFVNGRRIEIGGGAR